jgi:riboflavin synthase
MFTGLIQDVGKIAVVDGGRCCLSYRQGSPVAEGLAIGDSVSVDGVCLTVEEILPQGFWASVSPETLSRTTLGHPEQLIVTVNLETSLRVGSKIGGHFVTGHVDGVGCLKEVIKANNAWEMYFTAPGNLTGQWRDKIAPYLAEKGSIAVNGISLTIAAVDPKGSWFQVVVVPHSYRQTNLAHLRVGHWVNLETDILGKYVAKMLGCVRTQDEINSEFLVENGYF